MLLLMFSNFTGAQQTTPALQKLLARNSDKNFQHVIGDASRYRLQIIYTRIDRDRHNNPRFTPQYFNYDPGAYFNPASMVKMPAAFLALEKLHEMAVPGVDKNTPLQFLKDQPWQTELLADTTAADGRVTMAHLIKRAFLVSENDPYNRLYQFLGQQYLHERLWQKGYKDVRMPRRFLGLTPEQGRYTNPVVFTGKNGEPLFQQPAAYNPEPLRFPPPILIGRAHMKGNALVDQPFDFAPHNFISLADMQHLLQSVIFPLSVAPASRFNLPEDDLLFLRRYLSQLPSETPDPKYDETVFYDSYAKFFFRQPGQGLPPGVRVFNKVGWSYGFLTDVSYVADFENGIEYMLAATIYVNDDGVLNDGKYEYEEKGWPFLYQLGQTIYQHELKRKRKFRPDLSSLKIEYEKRDPSDTRPALKDVDN